MAFDLSQKLEIYAEAILQATKENLRKAGKGGGLLEKSLHFRIVGYEVQILSLEYGIYVDKGRKPNSKQPPLEAISKWIDLSGLPIPKSAVFPIAKSIGKNGIPATNFISNAMKQTAVMLRRELKRDIKKQVEDNIRNALKKKR